ncbi:uncharacterized protein LOC133904075 isoform X3 [Phragmites australis]|uniref:uncharacterized protein LOC133904075 isoform X3 n=1 Tax=Phragmites australis TaxID=29695 RepID=UPI002D79BB63|nr:uncharacterized protein LOC133904075 isoform X3 [Phragmites australis]
MPAPGSMPGQEKMEQAGGVTGGQGPSKNNEAKNGEPDAAASARAPKAATDVRVPAALPHHRRSKSASSGRNLEPCKHAASHGAAEQRCGQEQVAITPFSAKPDARKSYVTTAGGTVHQALRDHRPNASPNHRVSLENDVRQLQLHLHQERSIRVMLDQAIGRASSTLSPGHRHFPAQTKELIAEIELLEEEIANREQHVLTLYRSIFDQCMSGPSSGQSSGISSPAHTKGINSRTRRQPSIIPSAFCSSNKLPLQPFHIMASVSESGRTKNMLKAKIKHESFSSETLNIHPISFPPDPRKLPYSGSGSLARTLKDHLYQCPSKISEEMVRCMASIYYLLRTEVPEKPEKARSPFLSRSSTNVILPRRVNGEENSLSNNKCAVEVSSISLDKNHMPEVSYAITHYRLLVEQLERVDLSMSENSIKLAFWTNVYNSLIMHAYLAYGIPNSSLKRMALFHKAAYNIGGHAVTANSIEQALLCFRSPRIGRVLVRVHSLDGNEEEMRGREAAGPAQVRPAGLPAPGPVRPVHRRFIRPHAAGVHGQERHGGAGGCQAGVPAGHGGGEKVQEEGVPAAPPRAVRQGGVPRPRRRPPVGAARGGHGRGRPGAAGRHPAVRREPAEGGAVRRVAAVQR